MITYKGNRNLKEIIGSNKILNNKVIRKNKAEKKYLFCSPCYTRRNNLCCQQVEKTNVFKSYKTRKTYKIFYQLTCSSQIIIYLLQCRIWFVQYVGKSETTFNLGLNNHRKRSKKKDAILAWIHFQKSNHIFQQDAKFVLMEQIRKKCNTIEELSLILKKRQNFWILNVRTLYPDGLNQELNSWCIINSFAVATCSALGINASTIGSWRTQ